MFFRRFLALILIVVGAFWLIGNTGRMRAMSAYDAGYRAGVTAATAAVDSAEGAAPAPAPYSYDHSLERRGPGGFFGLFLPLLLIGVGFIWLSRRRRGGWHRGGPGGPGPFGHGGGHHPKQHDDAAGAKYA